MNQPEQFGKYILLGCVAVGGMAEIYKAKFADPSQGQMDIALKRVLPSYTEDESFVTMFKDEGMIAQKLNHPNIVAVYDVGEVNNDWYIAMEYIHGTDLRVLSDACEKHNKRFTDTQIARILCETAKALGYAHKCTDSSGQPLNIVHRDATPHNIMVTYDNKVKLMDFGIAKAASRATKTRVGTVKGKSSYMSPEQARGKQLDGRSDMFTIGTVAWEMLTGYRLFKASNDFEILSKVLKAEIVPPSDIDRNIPRPLNDIVMKTLIRDRDQRYPDCLQLADALENYLAQYGDGSDSRLGEYVMALTGFQGHSPSELPNYVKQQGSVRLDENGNIERLDNVPQAAAPAGMQPQAPQPIAYPNPAAPAGLPPSGQYQQAPFQSSSPSYAAIQSSTNPEMDSKRFPIGFVIGAIILLVAAVCVFLFALSKNNEKASLEIRQFSSPEVQLFVDSSPKDAHIKSIIVRADTGETEEEVFPLGSTTATIKPRLGDKLTLIISKDGYETHTIKDFSVLRAEYSFKPELIKEGGENLVVELRIETDPSGSTIKIDDEERGVTPLVLEDIPVGKDVEIIAIPKDKKLGEVVYTYNNDTAGKDSLKLEHEKAAKADKEEAPKKAEKKKAKPPVEATGPAYITVTSKPWSTVILDGKRLGMSGKVTKKEIVSGKHTLILDFPAQKERVKKEINIKKGETLKIDYDLNKKAWQ